MDALNDSKSKELDQLTYFCSEKSSLLIISLIGPVARDTTVIVEKLQEEIDHRQVKWVILNFHDVPLIETRAIPSLVRLQKAIREKSKTLRICFVKRDLLTLLLDQAAIRSEEIQNNLAEAIQSLGFSFKSKSDKAA